jgi:hypothetical protein
MVNLPLVLALVVAAAPVFALGETVLKFGGEAGWREFIGRDNLIEAEGLRPYKVLALGSVSPSLEPALDMDITFDEGGAELYIDRTGHYSLQTARDVNSAAALWARFGNGAAVFSGGQGGGADEAAVSITARRHDALFSAGGNIGDFSIEFWLYPVSMENGEEPFEWNAAERNGSWNSQNISCYVSKNRLEWDFSNFFFAPAGERSVHARLVPSSPILPKNWSHHLIRFDAKTGLLEYLVNGVLEAVTYTTASGAEAGEVFLPIAGERGSFTLGKNFNGMMDGFRVWRRFVERPALHSFPGTGRLQSAPIDMGAQNSAVLRVEASGGLYAPFAGRGFASNGRTALNDGFRFPDGAEMRFFLRTSSSPYRWDEAEWLAFTPGQPVSMANGRYVQIAVQFYPGSGFETTPYLEKLSLVFKKNDPPSPPAFITAVPRNGTVELSWRPSRDKNAEGYLVYYGAASGDYSEMRPVDAGKQTSVSIDGLTNGVLYYFSVSAYDKTMTLGAYSKEVLARPLKVNE